ncbi:MAG: leucine-rich repeat domain-containing protein [Ruminiclostridium sp.]|nr:leucine-rich repeat domain-containing protein [Ruminiclostridium sp.]
MKKFLTSVILLISAVMLCTAVAGAETYVDYGDYQYKIKRDGTIAITDYRGSATELEIPAEIDGMKVTEVEGYGFHECKTLVSVTIPYGVKKLGTGAFNKCTSLENISIPDSVTVIGSDAFIGCISLRTIRLPESLQYIGSYAFQGCRLESVYIPDINLDIEGEAFSKGAHFICGRRSSAERYARVYGLDYTYALDDETPIPDDKEIIQSGDYLYENLNEGTVSVFRYLGNDTEVFIPDKIDEKTVVAIGEKAFYDRIFTSVYIPDGVSRVGVSAFEKCERLESIRFPLNLREISERAFSGCRRLKTISLTGYITSIGNYAFYECESIVEINIPPAYIGEGAFSGCSNLTKVKMSEGITTIGGAAFGRCTSLEEIILPETLTELYAYAFEDCTSLKRIRLPKNLSASSIGIVDINNTIQSPFNNCTSLEAIEVDEENSELYSIDGVLFSKVDNRLMLYPAGKTDSVYEIPEGTKIIGDLSTEGYAVFQGNSYLERIIVPQSVTKIGRRAFSNIENKVYVEFPGEEYSAELNTLAFDNSPGVIIKCAKDSSVHDYAATNEVNFELYGGYSPDSQSAQVLLPIIFIVVIPVLLIAAVIVIAILFIKKRKI